MKKIYFLCCWLISFSGVCFAQFPEQTNAGRDFWFTSVVVPQSFDLTYDYYSDNYFDSAVVYIIGKNHCTGYIENPNTGFRIDFTVVPDSVLYFKIPENEIMCSPVITNGLAFYEHTVEQKGFYIHTSQDVFVYLQTNTHLSDSNRKITSSKIAVQPLSTYPTEIELGRLTLAAGGIAVLLIVATEDNTIIFFPDCSETVGGTRAFTDTLDKGEVLCVQMSLPCIFQSHLPRLKITTNCKKIISYVTNFGAAIYPFDPIIGISSRKFGSYSNNHYNYIGKDHLVTKLLRDDFSQEVTLSSYYLSGLSTSIIRVFDHNSYSLLTDITCTLSVGSNIANFTNPPPMIIDVPKSYAIYNLPAAEQWSRYRYNFEFSGSGIWTSIFRSEHISNSCFYPHIPADRQVKECIIPTYNGEFSTIDTNYAEVVICIKPESLYSTYLNDSLIPATAFDTFPYLGTRYYACQFGYYNDDIPEIFHIRSENGFSATLTEMGFNSIGNGKIAFQYIHQTNSGVNYNDSYTPHLNIHPVDSGEVFRCVGDTLYLSVTYNYDSLQIDWIVDGVYYANLEHLSVYLADTGTIEVQMIVHYNCPDTTHAFVRVILPPEISLASDTLICNGATIGVTADHAVGYHWSDGSEDSVITVTQEGIYRVTVSNNGCEVTDSINVSFYSPLRVDLGSDTTLCNLLPLLLDATNPHAVSYLWQDQSTNATYTVMYDGEYWVIVHDPCTGLSDTVNVLYLEPVSLNLGNDTTLCEGEVLMLKAASPYCDYLWHDGSTGSEYRVSTTGEYSVTVSNLCYSNRDTITVFYEICDLTLSIPNSFTPDGDGLNDYFIPQFNHPEQVRTYSLYIYDRWGMLQFRSSDLNRGWDAKGCHPGVYIYLIEYQGNTGGKKIAKGSVTVLKK